MSYLRTASYRAAAASLCRHAGHAWDGGTCSTCSLRRDDFTAPYQPPGTHLTGLSIGSMVPVVTRDHPGPARRDLCGRGHDAWVRRVRPGRPDDRFCRECRNRWQRDDRKATA